MIRSHLVLQKSTQTRQFYQKNVVKCTVKCPAPPYYSSANRFTSHLNFDIARQRRTPRDFSAFRRVKSVVFSKNLDFQNFRSCAATLWASYSRLIFGLWSWYFDRNQPWPMLHKGKIPNLWSDHIWYHKNPPKHAKRTKKMSSTAPPNTPRRRITLQLTALRVT